MPSTDMQIGDKEFFGHSCFQIENQRHYSKDDIEKKLLIEKRLLEKT